MQALRHYLLAVQFFTRIPVTGRLAAWVGYSPAMLRASAAHFPGVGWLAGGLSCAVFALLHQVQAGPRTAGALMQWQDTEPEDLLRTLMGLLFIRVFTADPFDDPECDGSEIYGCPTTGA